MSNAAARLSANETARAVGADARSDTKKMPNGKHHAIDTISWVWLVRPIEHVHQLLNLMKFKFK